MNKLSEYYEAAHQIGAWPAVLPDSQTLTAPHFQSVSPFVCVRSDKQRCEGAEKRCALDCTLGILIDSKCCWHIYSTSDSFAADAADGYGLSVFYNQK